jgi:hypothetical protein
VFPGGNEDEKDAGGEEKHISARTGQNCVNKLEGAASLMQAKMPYKNDLLL